MAGKNIKFLEKSSVKLNFSKKLMTPCGGFALLAKLFEKLELKEPIEKMFPVVESSPNGTGIYAKVLRFGLVGVGGRQAVQPRIIFSRVGAGAGGAVWGETAGEFEQCLDAIFRQGRELAKERGVGGRIVA